MGNYLLAYTGGRMAESDEERAAIMAAWGAWFGQLGDSIVDGGNPFAESTTVSSNGSSGQAARSGLTGYSILRAENLAAAAQLAEGCPVLANGGEVEVYETLAVM